MYGETECISLFIIVALSFLVSLFYALSHSTSSFVHLTDFKHLRPLVSPILGLS